MTDTINHKDIKAGDTLRVEWSEGDVDYSRTGTADHMDHVFGAWVTADGSALSRSSKAQIIHLLNRPKPKLPTTPGTLIIAKNLKYEEAEVTLINRGREWETLDGLSVYQTGQIHEWALAKVAEVVQ